MDYDNCSIRYKAELLELADFLRKKMTKKEFSERVAYAVSHQDSCGTCEALTMKAILQTGEPGILFCAKCCGEMELM